MIDAMTARSDDLRITMLPLRAGHWILAPVAGALAGLVYGLAFDDEPFVSAMRGAFIGAPVLLYERGVLLRRWRDLIRRAATPVFGLATLATYIGMIVIGLGVITFGFSSA